MRTAIIQDWFTEMRTGGQCLDVSLDAFPWAHVYTTIKIQGSVPTIRCTPKLLSFLPPFFETESQKMFAFASNNSEAFKCEWIQPYPVSCSHCLAKRLIPYRVFSKCPKNTVGHYRKRGQRFVIRAREFAAVKKDLAELIRSGRSREESLVSRKRL